MGSPKIRIPRHASVATRVNCMPRKLAFARQHARCLADDDDPYCFYHATPVNNLPAILRDGLQPGTGAVFDTSAWSVGKLFLAYGIEAGFQWQGFVFEMAGEPTALLEIRLTPAQIRRVHVDAVALSEGDECSFYVQFPVSPHQIRVVDSGAAF